MIWRVVKQLFPENDRIQYSYSGFPSRHSVNRVNFGTGQLAEVEDFKNRLVKKGNGGVVSY
jgi:hypothetical protein